MGVADRWQLRQERYYGSRSIKFGAMCPIIGLPSWFCGYPSVSWAHSGGVLLAALYSPMCLASVTVETRYAFCPVWVVTNSL
jgi:hypothetical protein